MLFLSPFLSIPIPHPYCHNLTSTYCVANDMTLKLTPMIGLRSNSIAIYSFSGCSLFAVGYGALLKAVRFSLICSGYAYCVI